MLLDQILGLPAGAVDRFVNVFGIAALYSPNCGGLSCGISPRNGNFSGSFYSLLIDAARFGKPDRYRYIPPMIIDKTCVCLRTKRMVAKIGII